MRLANNGEVPVGFSRRLLGQTGLEVSALGIGGGYGFPGDEVERAFDGGINYFFFGTWIPTYRKMEAGLRELLRTRRDQVVLATGTYFWLHASRIEKAVTKHLDRLGVDVIDIFHLAWVMRESQDRAVEVALGLKERGLIKHLAISSHDRKMLRRLSEKHSPDVIMVRYNAAHPGAEEDVFAHLPVQRPGVVAFNALKHGRMLKRPRGWSRERPVPTARQAYRFALSHPSVDLCLAGISDGAQLDDLLQATEDGPLSAEEMALVREFGEARHG